MLHRTWGDQQRSTSAFGLFRDDTGESIDPAKGNGDFGQGEAEYALDARLTYLPVWEHDGRCLVHVGGSYSRRNFNTNADVATNRPRLRVNAPIRLGTPFLLDTGVIADVESVNLCGGELAAQRGPLNFQSDIYLYQLNRLAKNGGDLASPLYWGGYVQVGYFLTGEHRPYKRSAGAFDRVRPHGNFFFVRGEDGSLQRGMGAWELVARYGYLDLHSSGFATDPSDATRVGGTGVLQDITLGVNWYLNPNLKWQFNWVRCYRDSDGGPAFDGHVDIWAARVVLDF